VWVDELLYDRAIRAWSRRTSGRVSLVDQVSFEVMRENDVHMVLAFDQDFAREGFEVY
jgi:predicted nucleic acid-binding protein